MNPLICFLNWFLDGSRYCYAHGNIITIPTMGGLQRERYQLIAIGQWMEFWIHRAFAVNYQKKVKVIRLPQYKNVFIVYNWVTPNEINEADTKDLLTESRFKIKKNWINFTNGWI